MTDFNDDALSIIAWGAPAPLVQPAIEDASNQRPDRGDVWVDGPGGEEVVRRKRNLHLSHDTIQRLDAAQAAFAHKHGADEALRILVAIDSLPYTHRSFSGWSHISYYGRAIPLYEGLSQKQNYDAEDMGVILTSIRPWRPGPLEWTMFAHWHCVICIWDLLVPIPAEHVGLHGFGNPFLHKNGKQLLKRAQDIILPRLLTASISPEMEHTYRQAMGAGGVYV